MVVDEYSLHWIDNARDEVVALNHALMALRTSSEELGKGCVYAEGLRAHQWIIEQIKNLEYKISSILRNLDNFSVDRYSDEEEPT